MYYPEFIENPKIVTRTYDGKILQCYEIEIIGKDYEVCKEASNNYWANSKRGTYGSGLCATVGDKSRPVRLGLLGEVAFSKIMGLPVDTEYKEGGDKQDFLIGEAKVDGKCASRDYETGLIYYRNEWGKTIEVDKDIYYFGFCDEYSDRAVVTLVGFALREDVLQCEIKPARKGHHLNIEVPYSTLRSIVELRRTKLSNYGTCNPEKNMVSS